MLIRERTEKQERETLSEFATAASQSAGRKHPEPDDPIRTCFQRDRDRILHCKSFRRLMYKTQVFISPSGDHYRTRLTHTLEVAQIARTIARALRLNEDLTEAIALGHDVGHTPFGHTGESALDEALKDRGCSDGFKHYVQSVRVLSTLERDGRGLNLTEEVISGIGGHSKGRADLSDDEGEACPSLEAAVVRVSDRIAYLNHDLDDGCRAEWFTDGDIPRVVLKLGASQAERVGAMVEDLVAASSGIPRISFSAEVREAVNVMKEFLFEQLYLDYSRRFPDVLKAKKVVRQLFEHFCERPDQLPPGYEGLVGAVDYVSGMTDRFAIRVFEELFLPRSWDESDGRITST